MPTRPEVDKAEGKAEANSHEAEAEADQNCSIFQPNFAFWPNFLQKPKFSVDFRRDFKISAQNGL